MEQRFIASMILDQLSYKTHIVSSGEEAVHYLENNSVDLVLLDMIMAGAWGDLRHIKGYR